MLRLAGILLLLAGSAVWAEPSAIKPAPVDIVDPVTVVLSLLAVVALILVLGWFVKRLGAGALSGQSAMRVLAQLPLSPREKLVLVEVGDKQILLGVSASNVNQLHVFDQPVIIKSDAPSSEFHSKLMQFVNKESKP